MIFALLLACSTQAPTPAAVPPESTPQATPLPDGFWDHWGDGKAELSTYHLLMPRHGELREGTALLNVVTETFTAGQQVKSDGEHTDEYPVLKLHERRSFQAGVYDFDLATSTFLPLDGRSAVGVPAKVSFSWQDWCGLVHQQLVVRGTHAQHHLHSYWDGRVDQVSPVSIPEGAIFGDTLPLVLRGLVGAPPSGEVPYLERLADLQLGERELEWRTATISSGATTAVEVADSQVQAHPITVAVHGGPTTVYLVEVAAPRRLLGWHRSDGERAELLTSQRLAYWEHTDPSDVALRPGLGLPLPQHPADPGPMTPMPPAPADAAPISPRASGG